MENLFPREGLLSVIILLKPSIIPLTFMGSSWFPSHHARAGQGLPLINEPPPAPLRPQIPTPSSPAASAGRPRPAGGPGKTGGLPPAPFRETALSLDNDFLTMVPLVGKFASFPWSKCGQDLQSGQVPGLPRKPPPGRTPPGAAPGAMAGHGRGGGAAASPPHVTQPAATE